VNDENVCENLKFEKLSLTQKLNENIPLKAKFKLKEFFPAKTFPKTLPLNPI